MVKPGCPIWRQRQSASAIRILTDRNWGTTLASTSAQVPQASGSWNGWDVNELFEVARLIGFTGADTMQSAGFWLQFAEIDPFQNAMPGDENMTAPQMHERAWNNSLAKAIGISFDTYMVEVNRQRIWDLMSKAETNNAGGSYFFNMEFNGAPRSGESPYQAATRQARNEDPFASTAQIE
jgi:hypothetical protein